MGEWKWHSSREIYRSPWIRLREDSVLRPDGKPGTYDVVEMKGGVGIVAYRDNTHICLVGQYRYAPACYSWEIPKGAFEGFGMKEDPLETAKRELREETGLYGGRWTSLVSLHTLMGSTNDLVHLFTVEDPTEGPTEMEATEDITVRYVTLSEFDQMVFDGLITDATSIAAVAIAQKSLIR
ncbi:MAG: NUDIX domain-containing protein [Chlorobium sp.]